MLEQFEKYVFNLSDLMIFPPAASLLHENVTFGQFLGENSATLADIDNIDASVYIKKEE